MRHDANKMTTHPHMCHSQIFDKTDSFLKPVVNIFFLFNLFAGGGLVYYFGHGWGEVVIKEGADILHQIYRFKGGVNRFNSWWE